MEGPNYFSIGLDDYQNLDTQKMSRIFLKDGNILEVNNNYFQNKYEDNYFNINNNNQNLNTPINKNDNAKLRKFNSLSTKAKHRNKNNNNQIDGFYVTPVLNVPKKFIAMKFSDNENIVLQKDHYHVESFVFKSSPKKYNYKPYKEPKRKSNYIKCPNASNYYCFCNCPYCIQNRKF